MALWVCIISSKLVALIPALMCIMKPFQQYLFSLEFMSCSLAENIWIGGEKIEHSIKLKHTCSNKYQSHVDVILPFIWDDWTSARITMKTQHKDQRSLYCVQRRRKSDMPIFFLSSWLFWSSSWPNPASTVIITTNRMKIMSAYDFIIWRRDHKIYFIYFWKCRGYYNIRVHNWWKELNIWVNRICSAADGPQEDAPLQWRSYNFLEE